MRQAIVSVDDPEGVALGLGDLLDIFEAGGLVEVEVLSCNEGGAVVRFRTEGRIEESSLEDHPATVWWERAMPSNGGATYLVEFDVGSVESIVDACDEDLHLCGAIDVGEDGFTFDIAGPQDAITETIEAYQASGASVDLQALRDFEPSDGPLDRLTDRQREILLAAYEMGYFDVPKEASTDEVARSLDLDDSTVSEHLQRAERNLLSSVLPVAG